jgi:L-seryl-tRNA(Ser) seleniumtransferase
MTSPIEHTATLNENRAAILRAIPSVDAILTRPNVEQISSSLCRGLVANIVRHVLADLRVRLTGEAAQDGLNVAEIEREVLAQIKRELAPSLRNVINATGVVLHTNLGRAPISRAAAEHLAATAMRYSNLEYDLVRGARRKRDVHTADHLAGLTGAEEAIVVNNNAAAIFLTLHTLAKGAEVIVSRGELVEIGDGFRVPDILAESGAELREVGTTNRTRIADYERAITSRTRLLLRVHPSNFRILGFTERPAIKELTAVGRRFDIPVVEDLGSGCLANLASAGIAEPVVRSSVEAGASMVTFSGDKLLGGPQAGIIAGKREYVERVRRNPLFRALRVDKLTISVLGETLKSYRRRALDEIPTLRMICISAEEMRQRAKAFAEMLKPRLPTDVVLEIEKGASVVGGGSTPDATLPTYLIAMTSRRHSAAHLDESLRCSATDTPVVARVERQRLVLDLRTVFPEEELALAAALLLAFR